MARRKKRNEISAKNRARKQYVYLLKPKGAQNDFDKYYIGITYDPAYRLKSHRGEINNRPSKNPSIRAAAESSGIEMVVLLEHPSRIAVSEVENALRPKKNMGWNIAAGGEKLRGALSPADKRWKKGKTRAMDIARQLRQEYHMKESSRKSSGITKAAITALAVALITWCVIR